MVFRGLSGGHSQVCMVLIETDMIRVGASSHDIVLSIKGLHI